MKSEARDWFSSALPCGEGAKGELGVDHEKQGLGYVEKAVRGRLWACLWASCSVCVDCMPKCLHRQGDGRLGKSGDIRSHGVTGDPGNGFPVRFGVIMAAFAQMSLRGRLVVVQSGTYLCGACIGALLCDLLSGHCV